MNLCRPVPRKCWLLLAVLAFAARTGRADEPAPAFAKAGLTFVDKHCVQCHGQKEPKADVVLHRDRDDLAVLKNRKTWESALEMVASGEMPPAKRPRPAPAEIDTFVKSVQAVFDRADRNARPDPGHVTIRRLNRAEYNNTVRDLVGVDFQPAEDFPSDDIGHGFDNIGDVLTLSPILMERYLAAAESIAARAIMPNPLKPSKRHQNARYCEPAGKGVSDKRFRPLSPAKADSAVESGPLHTPFKTTPDGEYIFRTRVYGKWEGDAPMRVALVVCGKELSNPASDDEVEQLTGAALKNLRPLRILKTVEVKAHNDREAEVLEARIVATPGVERVAIAICKPPEGEKSLELFVEYLEVEGPLDPRPASHRNILTCTPDKPQREQTREVLTRFASRAYRRPATTSEVERLAELVDQAVADGEKWEAAVQLAVQAVLVSPKFLFRVELDNRPATRDPRPIDEFQLASRLSYFLWSSMPDFELFALAHQGKLTANLEAQVRRMLKDPKAKALVDNFAMQWLQLRRLQTITPDSKLFPSFNESLRAAMLTETQLFVEEIVREDRSILDLIDAPFTYLNEQLAKHYEIVDSLGNRAGQKTQNKGTPIRGREFQRVSLAGGERGGLLTQASVLTVTSNPTRTSPVKRGRWVLEQILGTPPPPPPPNVPELKEGDQAELTGSLRQRMEQHRANPNCASCHARMDPIGFAFENYDAVGKFRTRDGGFPIDPSGTLPDGENFLGPSQLKAILKEKKDLFSRSLTEKLLTYALGRGLEYYDEQAVERIVAALDREDYRLSTLVVEITKSDPFRLRRGKE